jgi:hypothetical protein
MFTQPTVTMQELELEHAGLLPSRETLHVSKYGPVNSFAQVGYGNQAGLFNIGLANGSFNNILSLGSGNII